MQVKKIVDEMASYIATDINDPYRSFIFTPINSRDFDRLFGRLSEAAIKRGNGNLNNDVTITFPSHAVSACSCIITYSTMINNRQWLIEFCHYTLDNDKAIRASIID